jgi:hypothetical protein
LVRAATALYLERHKDQMEDHLHSDRSQQQSAEAAEEPSLIRCRMAAMVHRVGAQVPTSMVGISQAPLALVLLAVMVAAPSQGQLGRAAEVARPLLAAVRPYRQAARVAQARTGSHSARRGRVAAAVGHKRHAGLALPVVVVVRSNLGRWQQPPQLPTLGLAVEADTTLLVQPVAQESSFFAMPQPISLPVSTRSAARSR